MNNTWQNVENILNSNDEYQRLFKLAFNIDYIDSVHVVKAISQYERSLVSFNSKFDKFYRGEGTLSSSELNGYLFLIQKKVIVFIVMEQCYLLTIFFIIMV